MEDLEQLHATVVKAREDAEANCGCDWGIFCKKCGDAAIAERTLLNALLDANAVEALMGLRAWGEARRGARLVSAGPSEWGALTAAETKVAAIADQLAK